MKFNSFLEKKNSINLHTFCCKSSLDSAFKYHSNNFGKTLANATALACSGVCLPIWPKAHEAAALKWSSRSSAKVKASWTTPYDFKRKKTLI